MDGSWWNTWLRWEPDRRRILGKSSDRSERQFCSIWKTLQFRSLFRCKRILHVYLARCIYGYWSRTNHDLSESGRSLLKVLSVYCSDPGKAKLEFVLVRIDKLPMATSPLEAQLDLMKWSYIEWASEIWIFLSYLVLTLSQNVCGYSTYPILHSIFKYQAINYEEIWSYLFGMGKGKLYTGYTSGIIKVALRISKYTQRQNLYIDSSV